MRPLHSFFSAALLAAAIVLPLHAEEEEEEDTSLDDITQMSYDEKVAFAASAITEMNLAAEEVARVLILEEKQGDSLVIQCISPKLSTIRACIKVSERAQAAVINAIRSNSNEAQVTAYETRKIKIAANEVNELRAAALGCSGTGSKVGTTTVSMVSEGLTTDDEGAFDFLEFDSSPPAVSLFE